MEEELNTIDPVSKIHGNIEITFNSKEKELDPYMPVKDQIVLTVGKTGRANRLTFDDLEASDLYELAESINQIADKVDEETVGDIDEEEFDIDVVESGVSDSSTFDKVKKARELLKEKTEEGMNKQELLIEVSEQSNLKKEGVEKEMNQLMREGEMFITNEDEVKRMS